ncbi:MAG: hypothetical protein RR998_01475 [Oscillospiraceae bacterium]
MKRRKWVLAIVIMIFSFSLLWFSGLLPKQVAKVTANNYMANQENSTEYEFERIEYSPFHDSYFVLYTLNGNAEKTRSLEICYKYFPFFGVFTDSDDIIEN